MAVYLCLLRIAIHAVCCFCVSLLVNTLVGDGFIYKPVLRANLSAYNYNADAVGISEIRFEEICDVKKL